MSEERVRERFHATRNHYCLSAGISVAGVLSLNLSVATGIAPTACQWHLLGQVEVRKRTRISEEADKDK